MGRVILNNFIKRDIEGGWDNLILRSRIKVLWVRFDMKGEVVLEVVMEVSRGYRMLNCIDSIKGFFCVLRVVGFI